MAFQVTSTRGSLFVGVRITIALSATVLLLLCGICSAVADETATDSTGKSPTAEPLSPAVDVTQSELIMLPVRSIFDFLSLQPSVVTVRPNVNQLYNLPDRDATTGPEFNVRGARPYDNAYILNGVDLRDPVSGLLTANIALASVGKLNFTPGVAPVGSGSATGGLVDIVTRSGGDRYSGGVEVMTDNTIGSDYDQNRYSAYLGGPLPLLKNGRFFTAVERRWLRDREPSPITSEITTDGSDRLPGNWQSGWSVNSRLDYRFGKRILLTLTGDYMKEQWSEYLHQFLFYPDHMPRYEDKNLVLNARFHHIINEATEYTLTVSRFESERIRGDGVVFDDLAAYVQEYGNAELDRYRLFRDGDWFDLGMYDPNIGPGVDSIWIEPYFPEFLHYKSSWFGVGGELKRVLNDRNTLTIGGTYRRYTVRSYESLDATAHYPSHPLRESRYGFDEYGVESDDAGWQWEAKHPVFVSAYAQDRMEFDQLSLQAGLRLDRFDLNSFVFKDPANPLDPDSVGSSRLEPGDLTDSPVHTYVSPRLGMSVSIGPKGFLYARYGVTYQPAPLCYSLADPATIAHRLDAGWRGPFPSANIEPEQVRQLEIGGRYRLTHRTEVEVAAYHKNQDNLIGVSLRKPAWPRSYREYASDYEATAEGLEINIRHQPCQSLILDLAYSLSEATGTVSYPDVFSYLVWKNPSGTPETTHPLDYDQRHRFVGRLDVDFDRAEPKHQAWPLDGLRFSLLVNLASGRPYTPIVTDDELRASSDPFTYLYLFTYTPTGAVNSMRTDWTKTVDLMLEKRFDLGPLNITPFLSVQNLFDAKNVANVYWGTGSPDTDGYLTTAEGQTIVAEWPEFADLYELAERIPQNYGPPRQIYFGIRASF